MDSAAGSVAAATEGMTTGAATTGSAGAAAATGSATGCCTGGAATSGTASEARSTTPFSWIFASTRLWISRSAIRCSMAASGVGGSAPKYRSSAARSRKYSAIAFMVLKGSSKPSRVQEKVP